MVDEEPDPDEPPRRLTGYEPQRGTVYGVRFGTPGNLPGRLPEPKQRPWTLIGALAAGIILLIVGITLALALA